MRVGELGEGREAALGESVEAEGQNMAGKRGKGKVMVSSRRKKGFSAKGSTTNSKQGKQGKGARAKRRGEARLAGLSPRERGRKAKSVFRTSPATSSGDASSTRASRGIGMIPGQPKTDRESLAHAVYPPRSVPLPDLVPPSSELPEPTSFP